MVSLQTPSVHNHSSDVQAHKQTFARIGAYPPSSRASSPAQHSTRRPMPQPHHTPPLATPAHHLTHITPLALCCVIIFQTTPLLTSPRISLPKASRTAVPAKIG